MLSLSEIHYNSIFQNTVPESLRRLQPTELDFPGVQARNLHLHQASQMIVLNPKLWEPLNSRVSYSKSFHYNNNTYTFKTFANNREGKKNLFYFYHPNLKLLGLRRKYFLSVFSPSYINFISNIILVTIVSWLFTCVEYVLFITTLWRRYYCIHFADKEIEAKGYVQFTYTWIICFFALQLY